MSATEISNELNRLARSDVNAGRHLLAAEHWRQAAFLAQQAAEKSLKAALVEQGIEPPRTHDLLQLDRLLLPIADRCLDAPETLTEVSFWAVTVRYSEQVLPSETEITAVLDAVEAYLTRRGW